MQPMKRTFALILAAMVAVAVFAGLFTVWRGSFLKTPTHVSGTVTFKVGDDILHAKLGEGVVTDLLPGGIVVVRFAGEPHDRSLLADSAPIRKR